MPSKKALINCWNMLSGGICKQNECHFNFFSLSRLPVFWYVIIVNIFSSDPCIYRRLFDGKSTKSFFGEKKCGVHGKILNLIQYKAIFLLCIMSFHLPFAFPFRHWAPQSFLFWCLFSKRNQQGMEKSRAPGGRRENHRECSERDGSGARRNTS